MMLSNCHCGLLFAFKAVQMFISCCLDHFCSGVLRHGLYFAKDASYSVRCAGNPGGSRFMYLARVLVGQYCTGHFTMVLPPPKDPSRPEVLYDYVVDLCETPSIFVVFFDNQCYPDYLITFQ